MEMYKSREQKQEEPKRINQKTKDYLFYFMIFIIIALAIYLIWFTKTNGYECINEPLVYGVNHISFNDGGDISCNCYSSNSTQSIHVNKNNISLRS